MTVILDTQDARVERLQTPAKHRMSLLDRIYVEAGSVEDWELLHELHYKAENLGIWPRYWRVGLDGKTIGCGVMTVPRMLLAGRNELFKHLRPNVDGRDSKLINRHRATWINTHGCTNSRLVLDTMFRGAGIAYRAQNLMMRMTGMQLVEFQSSMSRFNPFAGKAGIKFTRPRRSANYGRGLAWFRRWFTSIPADYVGVMEELDKMKPAARDKCILEMRKFYYDFSSMEKSGDNRLNGTSRVDALPVERLLKNLQQLVFASPIYGVYFNPDHGRELPARLPLLAFDNQPTDAPLDLAALDRLSVDR